MTGRERLEALLCGRPVDRLSWTTLADNTTRSAMPPPYRDMGCLELYQSIGCDVMQFGNFNLPKDLRVPSAARLKGPPVETDVRVEPDGLRVETRRTPWGALTATSRKGHPIRHAVETVEDLRILRNQWAESHYEECDGMEAAIRRLDQAIGDRGVYCPTFGPSPVQQLIELDMGPMNFYALYQEHRGEVEELLDIMHARRMEEYEIVARRADVLALIPVENTSTTLISPALYRRLSLPQMRDFMTVAHRHGRKAILHMCGLLKGLVAPLRETGLDGINGLTPPTVGDLPFEAALDGFGPDLVIWGGILDGTVFNAPNATREDIRAALDRTFTPRVRQSRFLLWAPADGLPVPVERFFAVRDWMDENGTL